jgi:molybdopterin molybdotransferase
METPAPEMIAVEEAEAAIMEAMPRYAAVTLPLAQCLGRALREPLRADRAQPPFDRAAMDGIAVAFAAWEKGARRFAVEGVRKAGDPAARLASPEGCQEVMTGAVMPEGADCVVPVEDVVFEKGAATAAERASAYLSPWKNVHRGGSDCAAGEVVVPEGVLLTPPHLGAAAAFGCMSLKVAYAPSVAVVATGDELIDPSRRPAPHQLRRSNPYAVEAALARHRVERVALLHSRDEKLSLRRCIEGVMGKCDVLILTGGVSMGKTDHVPAVLKDLAIKPRFHKVRQKPGKPFWFGVGGRGGPDGAGMPVFALPGNPASVLVCLYRYVLPALDRAMGVTSRLRLRAVLAEGAKISGTLSQFRPVSVAPDAEGRLVASFAANQGSGDFSGWSKSDGFVELAAGRDVMQGEVAPYYPW